MENNNKKKKATNKQNRHIDKGKLASILYYVAAMCWFVCALANPKIIYLALGATFLCLGAVTGRKRG